MMLGGSPSQLVWTMTSTSEMSGSASSGIRPSDQIPAMTRSNVPVKTRNRLRAHHSITQLITLHPSGGVDGKLPAGDHDAVLTGCDRHLPSSARSEVGFTFVQAISLVAKIDTRLHGCHSHRRHGRHEERDIDLGAGNRVPADPCHFYPKDIAALAGRRRVRGQLRIGLWTSFGTVHRCSGAGARRRWNERTCRGLQLRFRINEEVG